MRKNVELGLQDRGDDGPERRIHVGGESKEGLEKAEEERRAQGGHKSQYSNCHCP